MCGCEHRYAQLMELYNSATGRVWIRKEGWGNMTPCNTSWYGVTCSNGDVTSIRLRQNYLIGGTLPESWWNMSALSYLDLSGNTLVGSLPAAWANISSLRTLLLSYNYFSGTLPPEWGIMSPIQTFDLYRNFLWSSLPSSWGNMSSMQYLTLSKNSLTGSLPAAWSMMPSLIHLDLSMNVLNGTLPALWCNMRNLQYLTLSSNLLTGSLPPVWGMLKNLYSLDVSLNSLRGSLPADWGDMRAMTTLNVYQNSLVGGLPAAWSNMSSMQSLTLSNNSLDGSLSPDWSMLASLYSLDVSWNSLRGSLPAAWGSMNAIQFINLRRNRIGGTLPALWCNMRRLAYLSLSYNRLGGSLPPAWSVMSNLNNVDVAANFMVGTLPAAWAKLRAMQALNLWGNRFTGSLPASWSNMSKLSYLSLSINSLTGTLPRAWRRLVLLDFLDLAINSLTGTLPAAWNFRLLQTFNISFNYLTGTLPPSWSMEKLLELKLSTNLLTGTIPLWDALWLLYRLDLSFNSLTGTLPAEWGTTKWILGSLSLQYNSLTGSLPATWGSLTRAPWYFDLHNNSLTGTVPATWTHPNINYLSLSFNCLYGKLPSRITPPFLDICGTRIVSAWQACGDNIDWAPSCRYVNFSGTRTVSTAARTVPPAVNGLSTVTPSTSLVASLTTRKFKTSSTFVSNTTTLSRALAASVSPCELPHNHGEEPSSIGLALFQHQPNASDPRLVVLQEVSSSEMRGSGANTTDIAHVNIACRSVARQLLLPPPPFGVTIAFLPPLPSCCHIANVTMAAFGQPLLAYRLQEDHATDPDSSFASLIIAPPLHGWVEDTSPLLDAAISMTIVFDCGPVSHVVVTLSVPVQGAERLYAGTATAATRYSQIASLMAVSATSASSLGLIMVVRNMVLCSANSVVMGGVIDFGLNICEIDSALASTRSAVVSNVVVIAAVTVMLLSLSAAWSLASNAPLCQPLLSLYLPSSLLPMWTALLPSTSASTALLFAHIGGSPCLGTDVMLTLLGAATVLCPLVVLTTMWV